MELARQPVCPDNPAAWLYRVVRNRALNVVRAEGRRNAHELLAAEQRVTRQPTEANPADAAELNDSLATLDAAAREIVVLRVWGGLAWQEIAELVGESKSSAQRTYVQALEQLRQALGATDSLRSAMSEESETRRAETSRRVGGDSKRCWPRSR